MKTRISDKVYQAIEQERHQKEVEFVAKKDANWIKTHLAGVHEKRGFDSYKKLLDDVAIYYGKENEKKSRVRQNYEDAERCYLAIYDELIK